MGSIVLGDAVVKKRSRRYIGMNEFWTFSRRCRTSASRRERPQCCKNLNFVKKKLKRKVSVLQKINHQLLLLVRIQPISPNSYKRNPIHTAIHSKSGKVCGTAFCIKKKIAEKLRKSGRHIWAIWGNFGQFWVIFGKLWIILGHSRAI